MRNVENSGASIGLGAFLEQETVNEFRRVVHLSSAIVSTPPLLTSSWIAPHVRASKRKRINGEVK